MSSSSPAIGSIRLSDSATPAVEPGLYRLSSVLDIQRRDPGGAVSPLSAPAAHQMHFGVTGPRFVLDRADLSDAYPKADAKGAFGDRLPHVVLGRRTLPWERAASDGTPWLALLLVTGDEAQLSSGALSTQVPAAVVSALQALDPFSGDPAVTVLRARDSATLFGLLPSRNDVRLLSHVRQVNLADSALAMQDDDGLFAVVTSNRLPLSASGDAVSYTACLVSLEGRDDVWRITSSQPVPPLIVLYSWRFNSTGSGGTFEHLAAQLDAAPFATPAATSATAALVDAQGGVTLQGVARDGSATAPSYRGPLLGLAEGQALSTAPGDISGTAAFELGRLLGASDGRFLRELVAWHRSQDTAARAALVREGLTTLLRPPTPKWRSRGVATAAPPLASAEVRDILAGHLAAALDRPALLGQVHPAALAGKKKKRSKK